MRPGCRVDVIHHIACRHQIEVEVWPPRIDLYFADERMRVDHKGALVEREVDPIDTQVRFEATVINSDRGVRWQVFDAAGGPGAGSIDATGLYQAPAKGGWATGHTDVVVATSVEDPLRKAYAWVTLLGDGPLKAPDARIEIWPKRVNLYYDAGAHDNAYIDDSNKMRLFRADIWHSDDRNVEWLVNGAVQPAPSLAMPQSFLYTSPSMGSDMVLVLVRARIKSNPGVFDEAQVILRNYDWPGLH
jgi:hypothetical protein